MSDLPGIRKADICQVARHGSEGQIATSSCNAMKVTNLKRPTGIVEMEIRSARDTDIAEINSIFNHEVEHSALLWIETPVTLVERKEWLAERRAGGFPVLVAEADGHVLGFGSYSAFRLYEGFRQTVEHSIYIASTARGRGVGRALLAALIDSARSQGKKVVARRWILKMKHPYSFTTPRDSWRPAECRVSAKNGESAEPWSYCRESWRSASGIEINQRGLLLFGLSKLSVHLRA